MKLFSVGQVAEEISRRTGATVRPKDISDGFYQRLWRDDECPVVSGRRVIPEDMVDTIAGILTRMGKLTPRRERCL